MSEKIIVVINRRDEVFRINFKKKKKGFLSSEWMAETISGPEFKDAKIYNVGKSFDQAMREYTQGKRATMKDVLNSKGQEIFIYTKTKADPSSRITTHIIEHVFKEN